MSQKPIDKRSPLETREAIWAAIRNMKNFTGRDVWMQTCCSKETVKEYLTGLTAAGYLEKALQPCGSTIENRYTLVRDCGVEAPRVRRDGTEITQGRSRENLWRTMRILAEFSPRDLAIHASTEEVPVAETEAKSYIYYLHKAGYLALVKAAKPGSHVTPGLQARYRLLSSRYSGPRPPMVQRVKQVYDPNTRKVVWSGGDE